MNSENSNAARMGMPPPPPSPAAAAAVDVQLLHVLRQQNITQSRVWRGVLVALGLLLAGFMSWHLSVLPSSSVEEENLHNGMHYLTVMYKLAVVGYIGEAGLVLCNRQTALMQWCSRCLLVGSWLVSGVLYGWWQHQQKAHTVDFVSSTFVTAVVMGPRLFAASCWLANRELRALDSDLEKLDQITPS